VNPPVHLSTDLRTFAPEPATDWSDVVDFAQRADRAGFDRLAVSDHVAFGEDLEAYGDPTTGGTSGGTQPTGPDGAWLEPVTTIAYLAAATRRVRFTTNILLAALRRPVVLAKMAATVDVLSHGRLDLGVGVGWQRAEYEAAGLSFEARGKLLDHTLEVCQTLWTSAAASYRSPDLTFDAIHQMPKPLQPGGVPIWVSGTVNDRSMDRLARFGSGWIPWGEDAAELERGVGRMRRALTERGRDPNEVGIVGSLRAEWDEADGARRLDIGRTMAAVPRLRELGVTDFRLAASALRWRKSTQESLEEVVGLFRSAAG
jgi:probable F420-dependent oxidoreductase